MQRRRDGRDADDMRSLEFEVNYISNAEGSCLVKLGSTWVVCTASVDERVPPFLRRTGQGWVTAEYGMLPGATSIRVQREAVKGRQSGRTQEIQRLIGRSLRAAVNLEALGERQITIDCDVIQADGGTRTAAINGGYIALYLALKSLHSKGLLRRIPIVKYVAAISCGIVTGRRLIDLAFIEDSNADVDANFIFGSDGNLVEVQCTGEKTSFSCEQLQGMCAAAKDACMTIVEKQRAVLNTTYL
ncbi:truncated RNase PH [Alphaproteobacteria bacterium]